VQNDDRDYIKRTISEFRESFFDAILSKHYRHTVLYIKCMIACIPFHLKLETIEAPEANQISNENATACAK
jgi:hypothetical protein